MAAADLQSVPDERLEAELCQLAADIAAGTARWFRLIAEYDRRQVWARWECRSMAHWLAAHVGVSLVTARQYVQVARRLTEFPQLAAEFDAGRLSYSRVRAVCRVVTPQSEGDLVSMALNATAPQLERFVAGVERASRAVGGDDEVGPHERRELVILTEDDGTIVIRGRLTAEGGTALRRAVEFEMQREISRCRAELSSEERNLLARSGVEVPFGALRADALLRLIDAGHVCLSTSDASQTPSEPARLAVDIGEPSEPTSDGAPSPNRVEPGEPLPRRDAAASVRPASASVRPLVVIHRYPDGDELESGPPISRTKANRLRVGADVIVAEHHHVGPGDARSGPDSPQGPHGPHDERIIYRRVNARSASRTQRRALGERDQGCRFPGCGRRAALHAHHVHEYHQGGVTVTRNLVLLCSMHHHAVHRNGWIISGSPHGVLSFDKPGLVWPTGQSGDTRALVNANAGPIAPQMGGEPFDLHLAVASHLHNCSLHCERVGQEQAPPSG